MLAAIGYYYNKPDCAARAIQQFKNFYPDTTTVVINDGGSDKLEEIAHTFKAHYIKSRNLGCGEGVDDIGVMIEWIERYFKAIDLVTEPFFINLEDDVLVKRPLSFEHLQGEILGINENARLPEKITTYLKQFNPTIQDERVIYSAAGGCIFRTDFFKKIMQEDWKKEMYTYAELTKRSSKTEQGWYFSDCCVSFLCLRYGGRIIQNPEFCDIYVHPFRQDAGIYHHHHRLV